MTLIEKATVIMEQAHRGQKRKTDGSPYVAHPHAVAKILIDNNFSEVTIAAGLTHDVLEDTNFSADRLEHELGKEVLAMVKVLSEDKSLDWEERKEKYVNDIKNASAEVKAVATADKIHNLQSLINNHQSMGPTVWSKFNRGKSKKMWFENLMLDMLKKNWSHPLIDQYESLVKKADQLS